MEKILKISKLVCAFAINGSYRMRDLSVATAVVIATASVGLPSAHADTITLDLSDAVLSGGVSLNGGDLKFDSNKIGTATFDIPSVPGNQYVIDVIGQTNQSSSFAKFFLNGVQLGINTNFGSGFNMIVLPKFTDSGTVDVFSITNGTTKNNSEVHIQDITVTGNFTTVGRAATPLPPALPLFALGLAGIVGLIALSRRRGEALSSLVG